MWHAPPDTSWSLCVLLPSNSPRPLTPPRPRAALSQHTDRFPEILIMTTSAHGIWCSGPHPHAHAHAHARISIAIPCAIAWPIVLHSPVAHVGEMCYCIGRLTAFGVASLTGPRNIKCQHIRKAALASLTPEDIDLADARSLSALCGGHRQVLQEVCRVPWPLPAPDVLCVGTLRGLPHSGSHTHPPRPPAYPKYSNPLCDCMAHCAAQSCGACGGN